MGNFYLFPHKTALELIKMSDILLELQKFLWLIIPLVAIQLILIFISIRDWRRKRDLLGDHKLYWLLFIIFINIIGPILYLYYSRSTLHETSSIDDEWEN
jgi:hypothetical protein